MTLYQRLGVLLLGEITSAHSVAIYGVAFTLVASAGFVATSITLASFPILSKSLAENNWSEVHEAVERKLMLIMTVYLPACIAGSLIAPWVISSIYSSSYKDVPLIMYALLPGLYISSINFALKYFMNGIKLNWHDALSAFVGILVFIVFLMIPKWKDAALMAGWAWGLGEVSNYLMKWYAIKRYFKQVSLDLMRHLITFIVLITVFFLLQDYYRAWVNSFYS
ncbi:MAG: hypothetical protein D6732_04230 [Methanobacteriota archaeon]|nr:MAG: hypothetical protein D6732_04230 [Euryarchaeota archaeon]